MSLQMIELEVVTMVETSDEDLEALVAAAWGNFTACVSGTAGCSD